MASERRGRSRERSVEIIESRTSRDANPRATCGTSRPRAPSHERQEESVDFTRPRRESRDFLLVFKTHP